MNFNAKYKNASVLMLNMALRCVCDDGGARAGPNAAAGLLMMPLFYADVAWMLHFLNADGSLCNKKLNQFTTHDHCLYTL